MSQQKVDAYKKSKATRATAGKKEKRKMWLEIIIVAAIIIAGIVWFAVSAISKNVSDNATIPTYTINTEAVDDYIDELNAEDTAADETAETSETSAE